MFTKKTMNRSFWAAMAFLFAVTAVMPLFPVGKARAAGPPVSFTETVIEDDTTAPEDPWLKTVGDINNDGLEDIVVGGNSSAPLVWYESPTWTKHVIDPADRFTTDGEVADVDGDGDNDVITIVSSSSSSIRWYENPGNPAQTDWAHHTIGARTVHDVEVVDLDGDGKLDVLTRNQSAFSGSGETVYIHKQITPTSWTEFAIAAPNGEGLKTADVDADGDTDFIVNGSWFENPGTISTTWAGHVYTTSWTHEHTIIAFADINNDGRNDIALSPAEPENTTYRISWFEAPTDRTQTWTEHTVLDGVETVVHFVGAADFNQDGYMDLAAAEMTQSNDDDEVYVLTGDGGNSWDKTVISIAGSHSMRIFNANGDNYPDLFGANWRASGRDEHVKLWTNNGSPTLPVDQWERHEIDDSMPWKAVFVDAGDINGDGRKDIISGGSWYEQPAAIGNPWTEHPYATGLNDLRNMALLDDFDDDGNLDIFGTNGNPFGTKMMWAKNDGAGNFTTHDGVVPDFSGDFPQGIAQIGSTIYSSWHASGAGVQALGVPADPVNQQWSLSQASGNSQDEALTAGDIDNDGDQDLLQGTKWLRNDDGTWTQFTMNGVGGKPDRNRLVDFNKDGYLDAVLGFDAATSDLIWLENPGGDSTGTWALHVIADSVSFGQIGGGYSMDIADFNGDGETDVVLGEHKGQKRLLIFTNNGNGASWSMTVADAGGTGIDHHDGTVPVDIDNDGDLDIISIGYDNPKVWLFENKALEPAPNPQADVVDVWYGNTQSFGDKGTPQNWINILGTADPTVTALSYTLNGDTSKTLSIGADERRLAGDGDFNIDLAITDLNPGSNTIVITATDSVEGTVTETVTVNYQDNQTWALPYTADWSAATQISDAAQVVDGHWTLTPDGIRSSSPDYDRLVAIGDLTWADYEVTVPITINNVDFASAQTSESGGRPAVGLLMRWAGHTDSPVACAQPKCGWEPFGAIGWWRWNSDQTTAQLQYYGANNIAFTPAIGTTYMMKQRAETQANGSTLYSMKVWEQSQPEPSIWTLTRTESAGSGHLTSGSLALITHHVDATYGDVVITPLEQEDTTPPVVSNVAAANVTENSATITWNTDEAADSMVEYGLDTNYGADVSDTTSVTAHSIDLNDLNAGTTYHYRVVSTDAAGNTTMSEDFTFTTPAPDTTAPVISNVTSNNITADAATITWDTDEAATSQVEYGTDTSYGSNKTVAGISTQHSVALDSLTPGTTYHYRVVTEDAAGNPTTSADFTFTTDAPDTTAPVISNVASSNVTAQAATVTWDTDEASDSQVEYGTTAAYGNATQLDTNLVTAHSVNLSSLEPETTYHYRVISKDAAGNTTTSGDSTFTTAALPAALEAHWLFDETSGTLAADASGNGHDGTLQQGASFVPGHTGNAVSLDGSNDYVDAGSFDVAGQELTISTWINPSQFTGNHRDNRIIAKATSDAEQDHYWMISGIKQGSSETVLRFRLKTNGITSTLVASTGNISLNQWSHAVARYDGSTMRLYLNGVEVGSTAKSGTLSTNSSVDVNIGRNTSGYGPWNGQIDDVRIYSRALTETEIQDLFAGETDTTAPVITNVATNNVAHDSATVTWGTDEAADSLVEYGTDTSYGNLTPLDDSLVTAHSVGLSGLTPETTYHYRVISKDAAGNLSVSNDLTFDTPVEPDTTAPEISDVDSVGITPTEVTINWTTDEPSSTQMEYGLDTNYGTATTIDSTLVTSHNVGLTGLTPETTYHYRVISVDEAGNESVSADQTFTTLAVPDTTAPEISNVASSNLSHEAADITWDTDEAATSQVEYGTTTAYGSTTTLDTNLVTTHSATLTGLAAETEYHYRVISTDAAGNTTTSTDFTFVTGAVPDTTAPVISDVVSGNLTETSADITWATDEAATSQVEYGTDTSYGNTTTLDGALVTNHNVGLSGLSPNTTYHYRVLSRDGAGNLSVSTDNTFTTETITLSVDAGNDQTVTLGDAVSLAAAVDYNGPSSPTTSWEQVSGPGTITFNDPDSPSTQATADAAGTYVLRVTVTDGTLQNTDTLTLTVEEVTADPDLLAHWLFDEISGTTAADASGNDNNATLQQGASFATGYLNNAVTFDGDNDYVDAGSVDTAGQALTLSAWINPAQFTGGHRDNRIISKAMSDAEQDHYWMISGIKQGSDTVLRFRLKTNGTTTTLIANTGNIALNQWSHVTATYDGSTMRLYLNGVEVGSTAKSGDISTNPNVNVRIGSNPSGYGPWNGQIDDVRIYSRALTATEIQQLAEQ